MKKSEPKSKYGVPFYSMQDWIDNEDWKNETQNLEIFLIKN
tara:strand:+ start:335 stop:457 length:123 start_codon:yes stop_codon:yes gene_type:complete